MTTSQLLAAFDLIRNAECTLLRGYPLCSIGTEMRNANGIYNILMWYYITGS